MNRINVHFLILCFSLLGLSAQANPRTVFVQLFEWPWKEVARECETYLGPAGFSAVQVSPPHEHVQWNNSPWWERFQVVSYKINSRGGTEADFVDMVSRCQKAGVDVYADAVLNHMTGFSDGIGSASSLFTHYNYPGLYGFNDFHHCGRNGNDDIANYRDLYEVQNCELVNLADLDTASNYVQGRLAEYLNHLLDLGVAGFRIDAAKHIPARDIKNILNRLKRSAYIYQEVIGDSEGVIKYSDYTANGDVTAYEYPYRLGRGIKSGNLNTLFRIDQNMPTSSDSIVFLTNHDLERTNDYDILKFSGNDQKTYRLAQIFMLAWPYGYPQVYSGFNFASYDEGPPVDENRRTINILNPQNQCQAPWTCEHRLPEVAAMIDFRNFTDKTFFVTDLWSNGQNQLSFNRGSSGFIAINFSHNHWSKTFQTSLPAGKYCNIVGASYNWRTRTCTDILTVDRNGILHGTLQPQSALVLLNRNTSSLKRSL